MGSRSPEEEGADLRRDSVAGQVLSRSRRAVPGGDSEAGAATRSAGEPAYPMSYIGAGEGLPPLRTPDRGERSPGPSITPAAPFFLSLDGIACCHWTIFSMTTSRPAWRSMVQSKRLLVTGGKVHVPATLGLVATPLTKECPY